MTATPDNNQADSISTPILDRVLVYVLCPLLGILVLFLFGAIAAAGHKLPDASDSLFPSLWLLAVSGSLLIFCVGLACWRTVSLQHQRYASVREAGLARRNRYFEDMLHLILDNIPNVIFISDRDGRIWFANSATAPMGKDVNELTGKTLDRIFPGRAAELMMERIRRAQTANAPVVTMDRHDDTGAGPSYFETYHIPLPDTPDLHNTVLVTQKDITAMIVERERQEQTFRQLVEAMIALIDRRDPYAAGHSLRVGMIATQLAQHLGLDDTEVETCRVAGSLMNLGKVMVPRRILMKNSALDPEELKLIRKSILASADILSLISFQIPVIPTLRHVLERYDGSGGPEGRKGDNILLTARIVALANAFVALVSPRAHRAGLSMEEAFKILNKDAGVAFDPQLVRALMDHMKNNPEIGETLAQPTPELKGVVDIDD